MPIVVLTFAIQDTDYVSKLNQNFTTLASALDAVNSLLTGTVQSNITAPTAFEALFGSTISLVGPSSYVAQVQSANIVRVSSGFAWLYADKMLVRKDDNTDISFLGAADGTYYIHIGLDGVPYKDQTAANAFYSVVSTGGTPSDITRLAKISWEDSVFQAAQNSTALGQTFTTLDQRLEAGELNAVGGKTALDMLTTTLSKNVAGGADITLTAAEAKHTYFEFTGALTADINVNFPLADTPRVINIKNSTTGEFALNCKGTGGTGKRVSQGYSTFMHHDGADMEYAMDDPSTIARVVPYAANITIDWSLYDVAYVTLTGNTILTFTGGRPGQKCLLYLEQDAVGGRTVTWPADVRYGADVGGITLSVSPNKVDEIAFSYNWVRSLYNAVSVSRGYAIV